MANEIYGCHKNTASWLNKHVQTTVLLFINFKWTEIRLIEKLDDIILEQTLEQILSQNSRSEVREKCGNEDNSVWLAFMSA